MHWHIINWNTRFGIIGTARYDNAAKSIADFLDICYEVFNTELDEGDRAMYSSAMLDFSEEDEDALLLGKRTRTHISHTSDKLNISWVGCDDEPCNFAVYN